MQWTDAAAVHRKDSVPPVQSWYQDHPPSVPRIPSPVRFPKPSRFLHRLLLRSPRTGSPGSYHGTAPLSVTPCRSSTGAFQAPNPGHQCHPQEHVHASHHKISGSGSPVWIYRSRCLQSHQWSHLFSPSGSHRKSPRHRPHCRPCRPDQRPPCTGSPPWVALHATA